MKFIIATNNEKSFLAIYRYGLALWTSKRHLAMRFDSRSDANRTKVRLPRRIDGDSVVIEYGSEH